MGHKHRHRLVRMQDLGEEPVELSRDEPGGVPEEEAVEAALKKSTSSAFSAKTRFRWALSRRKVCKLPFSAACVVNISGFRAGCPSSCHFHW